MRPAAPLLLLLAAAGWARGEAPPDNMNGDYVLSDTTGKHPGGNAFPTHFKDYPRWVEAFDVYSPKIKTLYSQVFWKALDPVPLPQRIVDKYNGKGMAVVGFEVNQVRRTQEGDISVPITVAYNHHFTSTMIGAHSRFKKIHFNGKHDPKIKQFGMGHGIPSHRFHWTVEDLGTSSGDIPTHQDFGGANGGEFRKSFHGYAPGFAQVIDSPTEFQLTPMQIDTWNRDEMNISSPTRFVPGPLPSASLARADATYSGLLECPVTTRISKRVEGAYSIKMEGTCGAAIDSAEECFNAVKQIFDGRNSTTHEISDEHLPSGCTAASDVSNPAIVQAIFNHADSQVQCAAESKLHNMNHTEADAKSLVTIKVQLDIKTQLATITMEGPDDVWFGVGFNATCMADEPYVIVVDGRGNVTERKIGNHAPGTQLKPSIEVQSMQTKDGKRTVVLTRKLQGEVFSFDPSATILNFINALGVGPDFGFHKEHAPSSLIFLPSGDNAGACLCKIPPAPFGRSSGELVYNPTDQPGEAGEGSVPFPNYCQEAPRSDLLDMKNPTCDLRAYAGGQSACHHMWSLLDKNQSIPWVDQPLEYQFKFRFWVQPYNATYHQNVQRTSWGIASPVEYDVPQCDEGVKGCSRDETTGTWIHTIRGTYQGQGKLASAHFHCHAPTCLSMSLYACDNNVTTCNSTTGKLLCEEKPIYGHSDVAFQEDGYIDQPPCLWGSEEFGLDPPPDVTGLTLHTVKTANATVGHYGEMAWQQIYYF